MDKITKICIISIAVAAAAGTKHGMVECLAAYWITFMLLDLIFQGGL